MRNFWTDDERGILERMISAGCNMREVMAVLKDRDDSAIRGQMKRLKLKFKSAGGEIDYDAFKKLMQRKGKVIECG